MSKRACIEVPPLDTALQDGMLAYYLDQAPLADANVKARIEREPFDFMAIMEENKNLSANRQG